jgi:hypothetical protein
MIARISGSAGSIVHTLIQDINYKGTFMPGFKAEPNYRTCEEHP